MDVTDPIQQIESALNALGTPIGQFALVALVLLAGACAMSRLVWWMSLAFAMFVTTLGRAFLATWLDRSMIQPWQSLMSYSRPLTIALLLILGVTCLVRPKASSRMRLIGGSAVAFLLMQLSMSLHAMIGGRQAYAVTSAVLYLLMFFGVIYGVSRMIVDRRSATMAVAVVFLGGSMFVLASMSQYFVRSSAALHNNRFVGVAANANFAALALSPSALAGLFLLLSHDVRSRLKPIILAMVATMVVLIAWTGTRNAVLMCTLGGLILVRGRLGRGMVVAVICGALAVIIVQHWLQVERIGDRLLSMEDTRMGVWAEMLNQFLRNPLLGSPTQRTFAFGSENSLLLAGSEYGLLVALPLLVAMLLVLRNVVWLNRRRAIAGEARPLIDMVSGGVCSLLAGSMFEGFLLANYSFALLSLLIYLAVTTYLTDHLRQVEIYGAAPESDEQYADEAYPSAWGPNQGALTN